MGNNRNGKKPDCQHRIKLITGFSPIYQSPRGLSIRDLFANHNY